MPKIDPAMQKQIDATIDAVLKKNKDIKAASDIDRTIDNYMKKNKEAMANARLIQQMERRLKDMETKIRDLESRVQSNASDIQKQVTREMEKGQKVLDKIIEKKMKQMSDYSKR